jgi:hypothetical protein
MQVKEKEFTAHNPRTIESENNVSTKSDLIKQSKEQTEALVNVTKMETFTKYIQKCDQQWQRRSITTDELNALASLIEVANRIYDSQRS